jgi:hypothetical protein
MAQMRFLGLCLLCMPFIRYMKGVWRKGEVPLTADGVITKEAEDAMRFVPATCGPTEVVFFSGYIPHRY